MRFLMVIFFAAIIFVFTCTASFTQFIHDGTILFRFTMNPNWSELLLYNLSHFQNPSYVIQKLGHMTCFFIFTGILMNYFHNLKKATFLAFSYAVFTEIAQLFFTRDGRLLDVGYDSIGIVTFVLLYTLIKKFVMNRKEEQALN